MQEHSDALWRGLYAQRFLAEVGPLAATSPLELFKTQYVNSLRAKLRYLMTLISASAWYWSTGDS